MTERTLKSMLADQVTDRVERTAAHLRDVANTIERQARDIEPVPGRGATSAAAVAASLVHTLMWGLANSGVDGIVSAAAEYDFHMAQEGDTP